MTKNYYDILGVKPTASYSEIRDSYRKLSKEYNAETGIKEDQELISEIHEAWETLKDSEKREQYDKDYLKRYKKSNKFLDFFILIVLFYFLSSLCAFIAHAGYYETTAIVIIMTSVGMILTYRVNNKKTRDIITISFIVICFVISGIFHIYISNLQDQSYKECLSSISNIKSLENNNCDEVYNTSLFNKLMKRQLY